MPDMVRFAAFLLLAPRCRVFPAVPFQGAREEGGRTRRRRARQRLVWRRVSREFPRPTRDPHRPTPFSHSAPLRTPPCTPGQAQEQQEAGSQKEDGQAGDHLQVPLLQPRQRRLLQAVRRFRGTACPAPGALSCLFLSLPSPPFGGPSLVRPLRVLLSRLSMPPSAASIPRRHAAELASVFRPPHPLYFPATALSIVTTRRRRASSTAACARRSTRRASTAYRKPSTCERSASGRVEGVFASFLPLASPARSGTYLFFFAAGDFLPTSFLCRSFCSKQVLCMGGRVPEGQLVEADAFEE